MTYQGPQQPWQQNPYPPVPATGSPQQGWGAPPPAAMALPPTQPGPSPMVTHQVVVSSKSVGAAVALELVLGLFGIFGIGNIYAGKVATGVVLMVSFWVLFWINVLLTFLIIGWVTLPLTWLAYLAIGAILAARAAERHNAQMLAGRH
ncbi:hypothetical protein ACN27F_08415 [Solwaraspora sp. WMMB335]|uniref:hypothetical protein n=1 Tax=Solwaraspora sp. WMMB335 TaxID=3404118 RepID=UPI003B924F29